MSLGASARAPFAAFAVVLAGGCAGNPRVDTGATCGDDVRSGVEVCDGTDVRFTCAEFGFAAGEVACSEDCQSFDLSGCRGDASVDSAVPPDASAADARADAEPPGCRNPFDNRSFEDSVVDDSCPNLGRPSGWGFADQSTGFTTDGIFCARGHAASDGSQGAGIRWTGNSFENQLDIWQRVDLTGIVTVTFDMLGGDGGNPWRSSHLILVDGTEVKDCGFVNIGEQMKCEVDVSGYQGEHEFKLRWSQRMDDNLGTPVVDNFRVSCR